MASPGERFEPRELWYGKKDIPKKRFGASASRSAVRPRWKTPAGSLKRGMAVWLSCPSCWSSSFGEATAGDGGGFFISLRRSCWSSTATVWRGVKNRGEINGKIKGGAQLMGRLLFCRRFIVQKIWAPLFCHGFIVPAFPVPLPFAVLPSGLAGVDYSVRCFPDSSVPGCCPSRCRFPYRFRYRCSGASPALPMPSGMSCALRTWLLLPGCDPACLPVLWVPGAGCPPLACLLSGGGRRLPWFFARAGRCVFRAGEPWDPG